MSSTSSLNQVFRRRMANLIERSLAGAMGAYVDLPNTPELRKHVTNTITNFLSDLSSQGLIGDASGATAGYAVKCDDSNNPLSSIMSGYLYVDVQVMLFPAAQQLRFRLEVGPTVVITIS
jgi:hypothetical protein